MLNAISDCCTLVKWSDEELEELDDPYLNKRVIYVNLIFHNYDIGP